MRAVGQLVAVVALCGYTTLSWAQRPPDPEVKHHRSAEAQPEPYLEPPDPHMEPSDPGLVDPNRHEPEGDFVWEDGVQRDDGAVEGFYRHKVRAGLAWTVGAYAAGKWVAAHWRPIAKRAGHVWVMGHRGRDGYWVPGHWRRTTRPGHVWRARRKVGGVWVHGHWTPRRVRAGHVWVAGHRTPTGRLVAGHWRAKVRTGHRWVNGRWRYGRWAPGRWVPTRARPGKVWVPGHMGPRGWTKGHWRVKARKGRHWVAGHWNPAGVWVKARWARGPRPAVHRKAHRASVREMKAKRRAHRRHWRRGKADKRHGRKMVRQGRRMEKAGRATDNDKLEDAGKRRKREGRRKIRRGKRKHRRSR